jgi:predicted O-methyltransferase YrrM
MRREKQFNNEYYKRLEYIKKLYGKETMMQKTIRKQSKYEGFAITINEEEGRLLSILTTISGAKKVLEIGTLFGYSTMYFADVVGKDGKITTIETDKYECEIAMQNFKKAGFGNIEILCGSALKILPDLNDKYDIVFIDADKINYIYYLEYAEKLLKKGGLLIADNTMLSGAVCREYLSDARQSTMDNMKEFNKKLANNDVWNGIMLNTEEGMSIAIKK